MSPTCHLDIQRIFPLLDRQQLIVHLSGWDWEFRNFGPVTVTIDDRSFTLNYVGFGDMKGTPVLTLKPIENDAATIAAIARLIEVAPRRQTISRMS